MRNIITNFTNALQFPLDIYTRKQDEMYILLITYENNRLKTPPYRVKLV